MELLGQFQLELMKKSNNDEPGVFRKMSGEIHHVLKKDKLY